MTETPTKRVPRGGAKAAALTDEPVVQQAQNGAGIAGAPPEPEQTRAAPAQKIAVDQAGQAQGQTEPVLTRRKRTVAGDDRLDLPKDKMKPGWDYEWKTQRVMGQDVDSSESAMVFEQGWRPVLASEFPDLVPPGYEGKHITRLGMMLFTRPMHLTLEARAEDYNLAETQKYDKLMSASAVQTARPGMINATKPEVSIEGVVGSHKAKAAAPA